MNRGRFVSPEHDFATMPVLERIGPNGSSICHGGRQCVLYGRIVSSRTSANQDGAAAGTAADINGAAGCELHMVSRDLNPSTTARHAVAAGVDGAGIDCRRECLSLRPRIDDHGTAPASSGPGGDRAGVDDVTACGLEEHPPVFTHHTVGADDTTIVNRKGVYIAPRRLQLCGGCLNEAGVVNSHLRLRFRGFSS